MVVMVWIITIVIMVGGPREGAGLVFPTYYYSLCKLSLSLLIYVMEIIV